MKPHRGLFPVYDDFIVAHYPEHAVGVPVNVMDLVNPSLFPRRFDAAVTSGNQRKHARALCSAHLRGLTAITGDIHRELHVRVEKSMGKRSGATGQHRDCKQSDSNSKLFHEMILL